MHCEEKTRMHCEEKTRMYCTVLYKNALFAISSDNSSSQYKHKTGGSNQTPSQYLPFYTFSVGVRVLYMIFSPRTVSATNIMTVGMSLSTSRMVGVAAVTGKTESNSDGDRDGVEVWASEVLPPHTALF